VIWDTNLVHTLLTTSSGMLNAFTAHRQGFNGDLAQLLSYQASGGIAYVGRYMSQQSRLQYELCRSTKYISKMYPLTVGQLKFVHMNLGHLFGSQHTHACVWNGNNTAIDGCYSVEGNCSKPWIAYGWRHDYVLLSSH
jgi:hypothetical protein